MRSAILPREDAIRAMTSKLDSKETTTSLQVTAWDAAQQTRLRGIPAALTANSQKRTGLVAADSSIIVAVLERFGHEISSAAAESDCSNAKARDSSAQLSVGKRRLY